jgi:hypothetical protein
MTIRILNAVAIATFVLSSPVLAQDQAVPHKRVHALRHYSGSYNQVQEGAFAAPQAPANGPYFEHDSIDPSRVGGHNPNFNPPS